MSRELVIRNETVTPATVQGAGQAIIPATIADAGEQAAYRFFEFFTANIRNPNTRKAYHRAAFSFFDAGLSGHPFRFMRHGPTP